MATVTGQGGKGDAPRPSSVSEDIRQLRWELAFGNPEQKKAARAKLKELKVLS